MLRKDQQECPDCGGGGDAPPTFTNPAGGDEPCHTCKGSGYERHLGRDGEEIIADCPHCTQ